jgi:ComF family protein
MAPVARCVADFLVDDRCHLCARAPTGGAGRLDPVRGAVARAARVGWFSNHPVCPRCASLLVRAGGEGVAGWRLPGGAILTPGGTLLGGGSADGAGISPCALRLVSAFRTDATLLQLIHLVKFSRVTSICDLLAEALAAAGEPLARSLSAPVLVPVPMDPRSRRRRGFNQAERIARVLGRRWSLPVVCDAVVKPDQTRPQSLAPRDGRLANVCAAFGLGPGDVRGRDAIVVDDLVTTGATAAVVARALGAGGAASVSVASVGRAL